MENLANRIIPENSTKNYLYIFNFALIVGTGLFNPGMTSNLYKYQFKTPDFTKKSQQSEQGTPQIFRILRFNVHFLFLFLFSIAYFVSCHYFLLIPSRKKKDK